MPDFADLSFRVDSRPLRDATNSLNRLGQEGSAASARLERGLGRLNAAARSAGGALATIGVGLTLGSVVDTLGSFEAAMAKVAGVSRAGAADLETMRDMAKELGATTEFTATQAAEAFTFLSMAGLDAKQSMAAIAPTIDLATVAAIDLGSAADMATNVMGGFGKTVSDLPHIMDVMADAAARSNTSVSELGDAFVSGAPAAKLAGVSIEDAAAAVGVLSNAGIKASQAGTALNALFVRMLNPTKRATDELARYGLSAKDVDIKARGLVPVLKTLGAAGLDAAALAGIAEQEHLKSLAVLIDGADNLDSLSSKYERAEGAAGEMAATFRNQLGGSIKGFVSAIEGLVIALGEAGLTNALDSGIKMATEFVRALSGMESLGTIASMAGAAALAIGAMVFPMTAFATAAVATAVYVTAKWDELKETFPGLVAVIDGAAQALFAIADAVQPLAAFLADNFQQIAITAGLAAGVIATKLAISLGATFVGAAAAAASSAATTVSQMLALERALGATSTASAVASVATKNFQRALVALRGALISTGIGALVVGAGYLISKLVDLKEQTGSWARMLELLRGVAVAVWEGIVVAAGAMPAGLAAVWGRIQSTFYSALSGMQAKWREFLGVVIGGLNAIPGIRAGQTLIDLAKAADTQTASLKASSDAANLAADAMAAIGAARVKDGIATTTTALEGLKMEFAATPAPVTSTAEALDAIAAAAGDMAIPGIAAGDVLGDLGTGAGGAAGELDKLSGAAGKKGGGGGGAAGAMSEAAQAAKEMAEEIERLEFDADPVKKYTHEVSKLDKLLKNGLSEGAYSKEIEKLNEELANSLPLVNDVATAFGDWLSRGFTDFKGFASSIWQSFQKLLSDMVAAAARKQILIGIGAIGGKAAGAPGAGTPGGGLIGSVLGGGGLLGGLGSAFSTGVSSFLTGGFSGIGTALAGATSGLTGLATAAGALALPLAGVALAFTAFRKKVKELDAGITVAVHDLSTSVYTFREIETSRLFGLLKKRRSSLNSADAEVADPITKAMAEMQRASLDAAKALGVGAQAFKGFRYVFQVSTKGLSEDEALRAVQEELARAGDAFAGAARGINGLRREGEGAAEALQRTASSLATVNAAFGNMGFARLNASLLGGHLANRLVELSGGIEGFASATQHYFDNIMSTRDRFNALNRQFSAGLRTANINGAPSSTAQFQARVERFAKRGDVEKAVALINLAPLFDQLQRLRGELDQTGGAVDGAAARLERQRDAEARMRERAGLQTQLMRLQGRTAELRRRELAALDPTNRALQKGVWRLEALADREVKLNAVRNEARGLQDQIWRLTGNVSAQRARELAALDPTNRALQKRVYVLEDAAAAEARASAVADERLGLQRRIWELTGNTAAAQRDVLRGLNPANRGLQQLAWRLEAAAEAADRAAAIEEERLGLQRQVWELTGNTVAQQWDALRALDPANRALQQWVWKLEAAAEAADRAAAVEEERLGLQRRIWELTGNVAAQQWDVLRALDPANRALQQRIFALEAAAEREERAAQVADERTGLEARLLELQGNTAELRRRELAGLDATNRGLQLMIWGLEDAQKAMEALDPENFVSRLDYERARARAAQGYGGSMASTGVPPAVVPQTPAAQTAQASAMAREIRDLVRQVKELTARVEQNTFKSAAIAARQERQAAG